MSSPMSIKGLDKLYKKLARLEKTGARRASRKATSAGLKVLRDAVKVQAPQDEGDLKKAQTSKISSKGLTHSGVVGADVTKLQAAVEESPGGGSPQHPTNIDHLLEFGHVGPNGSFIPPAGYMRRAANAAMPRAEARYASKLKEEIEAEASK